MIHRRSRTSWAIAAGLSPLLLGCAGPSSDATAPPTKRPEGGARTEPAPFVASSEAWTFENSTGEVIGTPNYRIYTTTSRQGLKDRIPRFMESALLHYRTSLVPLPPPSVPMETYLLANHPQWTRVTQRLMGPDAEIYLRIPRGGFAADGRAILYEIGPHDTYAISAHEGWHQFTQRTFRNPLPIWLEEGLACYMEGFRWKAGDSTTPNFLPWANVERYDELRRAVRGKRLLSLDQLTRTSPQELMERDPDLALTYYAQLWALVHFLNEGDGSAHRESLRQVIVDAQAGRLVDRIRGIAGARAATTYSFRRLAPGLVEGWFGEPIADLDASYQAFIADITRIGGKEAIVAGRSPVSRTAADERD